jgi:hypothetical protein
MTTDTADAKIDKKAWSAALRAAIDARDEKRYREELTRFVVTKDGALFVAEMVTKSAALAVMRRSFRALAPLLGVEHPNELVTWLAADAKAPRAIAPGARDAVSVSLPYFRFAKNWADAARKEPSYAVAMALMFFEPVLALCEAPARTAEPKVSAQAPGTVSASTPAVSRPPLVKPAPSFARITQRA